MSKAFMFIAGFLLLSVGLGLVLKNWEVLAIMIKAFVGILLALGGIVMMFAASLRR